MSPIRAGQIIYELAGIHQHMAYKALTRASFKLPFKTKIVRLIF